MAEETPVTKSFAEDIEAINAFVSSPAFFPRLLDSLYEGVYFVDTHRRILYWNTACERITGYTAAEVVGHYCQDNILNHVDELGTQLCYGKCPLLSTIEHGIPHECEIYLHHKYGHRVPVRVSVTPIRDTNRTIIGAVEMFLETSSQKARDQRSQHLLERGFLDPLTETGNRRFLEIELFRALQEFRQHGLPFGAILADIDHLKIVNEHYGHTVGDQVLRAIGKTLVNAIGDSDIIGRWSVDEFLILVPSSSVDHLTDIAERCRVLVERASIALGSEQLVATISAGASAVDALDTMELFMRRLENLLHRSKYSGRNRVTTG